MSALDHVELSTRGMETCPHLGLSEDPHTCLAYPSEWNLCHRAHPASLVRFDHQRKACLSSEYVLCTVFQNKKIVPLPKQLQIRRTLIPSQKIALYITILLLIGFAVGRVWLRLY